MFIAKVEATILPGQILPVQYVQEKDWLALLHPFKVAVIVVEKAERVASNSLV